MKVAVIGARGSVGRVCVKEIEYLGHEAILMNKEDEVPSRVDGVIIAAPIDALDFANRVVDCSGELPNTSLVLPNIKTSESNRLRIPNCMATLIAKALATLHEHCTITSIIATCMQSASGRGWRGVQALEQNNTEELFGGQLLNNVLQHEKAEHEERAIKNDLNSLFGCSVTATSFRVPVFIGHTASLRIETKNPILAEFLPSVDTIDPRSMENKREVAISRVRIQKKTADLVVCGDQLLCGTAIPAVASILGA